MAEQKSSSAFAAPLRNAVSTVRRVPGAGAVTKAAEETLDKIGAVSPRSRRLAVYAGAGMLGVAGVVEWPVALTGAAVAWLTQPRPGERTENEPLMAAEDTTDGASRGAYVAMGDAVTAQEGAAAPGPVREGEMPGGPAAPATEPTAPPTTAETTAPPAAAEPTEPPPTVAETPPTGAAAPPTAPTAPPTS
ncbi:hypothetical protein ABTY98_19990 [Streptomyces sp. NPDC096040]|uniref:hypothetical protein n=1 Tax=Streptomyces sp. NPDC096040 TaxID=3155541 RepID=UPI0033233B2B